MPVFMIYYPVRNIDLPDERWVDRSIEYYRYKGYRFLRVFEWDDTFRRIDYSKSDYFRYVRDGKFLKLHHCIWFEAGREIPDGFSLGFKDSNKGNIELSNLVLKPCKGKVHHYTESSKL